MKDGLHPTYHENITATCACGYSFKTGSTEKAISVEVCSNCHPFYTGKQKLVDAAGRVDKFRQRLEKVKTHKAEVQEKSASQRKTAKKQKKSSQKLVRIS